MSLIAMTGAESPLGSALRKRLSASGHEVMFMTADMYSNPESSWQDIHGMIHLNGVWNAALAESYPMRVAKFEVADTRAVVKKAREVGHWLLYASSCEVYGNTSGREAAREEQAFAPVNLLGHAKVLGEALVRTIAQDVPTGILRVSNLFGQVGDEEYDLHVGPFARAALAGGKVKVRGPGVVRDYLWYDHAAAAFEAAMKALEAGDKKLPALNIASGEPISTGEIASKTSFYSAARGRGGAIEFDFGPASNYDVTNFVADVTRAKHHLGWEPGASFGKSYLWLLDDIERAEREAKIKASVDAAAKILDQAEEEAEGAEA